VQYQDRIVAVIVSPVNPALLVALEAFILARGPHPGRRRAGGRLGAVFQDLQALEL
jgi:hypothetical protein